MTRKPLIGLLLAALIGALCALALVGALYLLNGRPGFDGTTAATTFGWLLPLVAGLTTAVLSVGLLAGKHSGSRSSQMANRVTCDACGESIFHNWRLCPHCGARLTGVSPKRD